MRIVAKLRQIIGKKLRNHLQSGRFYRIPFGSARGQFVEFHPTYNLDILFGLHEPNTLEVFRQLVKPGMVFADVGANHGYLSVYLYGLVGPGGRIYAFEPVPDNFSVLERTLTRNKTKHVKSICAAVSNRDEPLTIYLSSNPYMASMNVKWANTPDKTVEVQGIRLDTFFQQEEQCPEFIKMDIEGSGKFALEGMQSLITEHQPFLLLESHTPEEDLAIGQSLMLGDYAVFRVGSTEPVEDLTSDYRSPYGIWGTVLGVPKTKIDNLKEFNPQRFQKWRLGQRGK